MRNCDGGRGFHRALVVAAFAAGLGISGCTTSISLDDLTGDTPETASAPPAPAPKPASPAPAPAAARPTIPAVTPAAFSTPLAASSLDPARQRYERFAQAVRAASGKPMRRELEITNTVSKIMDWKPSELAAAWIVRNARIAAETASFREAVVTAAGATGQSAFLQRVEQDPDLLAALPGAADATASVQRAIALDSQSLRALGQDFRDAWMRLQGQASAPRANAATCGAATPAAGTPSESRSLMDQVLILAARMALGATEGESSGATFALLQNKTVETCLKFAQLNLNQCMAARRGTAEAAYCAGRHAADEVAGCLDWVLPSYR